MNNLRLVKEEVMLEEGEEDEDDEDEQALTLHSTMPVVTSRAAMEQ